MRKVRIYTPQALTVGQEVELETAAAHHVGIVLRMMANDSLILFNGSGGEYSATLTFSKKGKVRVNVDDFTSIDRESPLHLHLYQGLSKGDHMDFSIQKAVELGVKEITPIFCERSQFKLDAKRLEKKIQHWQQIIVSAAQQSWRCELPVLNTPVSFIDAIQLASSTAQNALFDVEATEHLHSISTNNTHINCWIGPEGGFSSNEVTAAKKADMPVLSLGPRVLRTETATVTALSLFQYVAGDLK